MTTSRRLRNAYHRQKSQAAVRKITFFLTFEQWLSIWLNSGRLEKRGRKKHQYVMARLGDRGAYAIGNVKIVTVEQNRAEQKNAYGMLGRKHGSESRHRISASLIGNTNGRGNKGRTFSPETIEKMRQAQLR